MYASKNWDSAVDKSQRVDKSRGRVDKSQQPRRIEVRGLGVIKGHATREEGAKPEWDGAVS